VCLCVCAQCVSVCETGGLCIHKCVSVCPGVSVLSECNRVSLSVSAHVSGEELGRAVALAVPWVAPLLYSDQLRCPWTAAHCPILVPRPQ
jgi:hypothetical protein